MGTLQVQKMPYVALSTILQHLKVPATAAFLEHWNYFNLPFPRGADEEFVMVPNDIVCDAILEEVEAVMGSRPFYQFAQHVGVIPPGFLRLSIGDEKPGVTVRPEDPNGKPEFFDEHTVCHTVLDTFQQRWEDAVDEDTMILLIHSPM